VPPIEKSYTAGGEKSPIFCLKELFWGPSSWIGVRRQWYRSSITKGGQECWFVFDRHGRGGGADIPRTAARS